MPDINRYASLGGRHSIAKFDNGFQRESYFEVLPGKVALFFITSSECTAQEMAALQSFGTNPTVKGIAQKQNLFLIPGHNYVDITSNTKGTGLELLFQQELFTSRLDGIEHVVRAGDSLNDELIFRTALPPLAPNYSDTRLFVGKSPVWEKLGLGAVAGAYHMPETYCAGVESFLGAIRR